MNRPPRWVRPSILMLLSVFLVGASTLRTTAQAQTPDDQALQIERKLLCPQCTNLRLDVCDTPICADMRAEIRDRVGQGQSEQEIVGYFEGRFGQRVLADVPERGFNLVLFGWVGASVVLVAALGTFVLLRLRRTASASPLVGLDESDERWLDDQLATDGGQR